MGGFRVDGWTDDLDGWIGEFRVDRWMDVSLVRMDG